MKTAKEWAEYLPLDIKLWFIEECERQGCDFKSKFSSLCNAIYNEIDWDKAKLIDDFWYIVWQITLDYKGREEQILTDLEWIDELVFDESGVCLEKDAETIFKDNIVSKWGDFQKQATTVDYEFATKNKPETLEVVEQQVEIEKKSFEDAILEKINLEKKNKVLVDVIKEQALEIKKQKENDLIANSIYKTPERIIKRVDELVVANDNLVKSNEALKSTIEGLNTIVKTQKSEIEEQAERLNVKDNTIKALVKQLADVKLDIINLENNNHELLEQIKPTKPTLLNRFLNWFKG